MSARSGADAWRAAYPRCEDPMAALRRLRDAPGRSQADVDALAIAIACALEGEMRDWLAGRHGTGLVRSRYALVSDAYLSIRAMEELADRRLGAEAGPLLDRALAILEIALASGLRVYQYDPPGYDEITGDYRRFLALRPPTAGRVVLVDPPVLEDPGAWIAPVSPR